MKSLSFVKSRIESGNCNNMNINNYKSAHEYNFSNFINTCSPNIQSCFEDDIFMIILRSEKGEVNVTINHDPNAEFEYFTMESCRCDGTLCFMQELMESIILKLFQIKTVNIETTPDNIQESLWDYNLEYTVGNFVLNQEFGDFGTEEKPWMQSRFTAMLPIKCKWVLKDNLQ